jgi:ATPase subunit of ABC transporter with duplicated ATPase domains
VFDLVDRFENEKKTRQEQEERERQKTERERQEYMKKAKAEAEKDKLYRERKEEIKKADREKRMAELNTNTIDISRQKMLLNQFERDVLRQDKDFRELGHHYFKTTDYRTNIPPPFLHRLDIDLNHIGKSLLSAAGKYANTTDDEESDMDMGSETGMEDLD